MQWWFILQSTICFNAFEILFRPAQFHEQSVQPSTQQTFDQHLVQACQWKQHIHNSSPTPFNLHQLAIYLVISRFPTSSNPSKQRQAGLQLGSGHGQFSRHRDLPSELRAAAWNVMGVVTETGCFHGRKPPMYGHVNLTPYFHIFNIIQIYSTIHF